MVQNKHRTSTGPSRGQQLGALSQWERGAKHRVLRQHGWRRTQPDAQQLIYFYLFLFYVGPTVDDYDSMIHQM